MQFKEALTVKPAAWMIALSAASLAGAPALADEGQAEGADAPQQWHVMISLYESVQKNSCGDRIYKVSTAEPIVIDGPDTITVNHINTVVGEWIAHLRTVSPAAWRMVNGDTGDHVTDVYFRRSHEEAVRAFTRDGHLEREPGCWGSVLMKHPVESFAFSAPADFVKWEFGQEPPPPPGVGGVARDLAPIPGLAKRD